MANTPNPSQGLQLQWDSSGSMATIPGVHNLQAGGVDLVMKDVTNFGSGGWQEMKPTLKNAADWTFDIFFDPKETNQASLWTDMLALTKRNFQVLHPDSGATVAAAAGYVAKIDPSMKPDDNMECKVTIVITGSVTRT